MKDTMRMMRERERGSEKRRSRGRESDDGHRDIRTLVPPPSWASSALFCDWTLGRQMTSGRTCDMLSCGAQRKRRSCVMRTVACDQTVLGVRRPSRRH